VLQHLLLLLAVERCSQSQCLLLLLMLQRPCRTQWAVMVATSPTHLLQRQACKLLLDLLLLLLLVVHCRKLQRSQVAAAVLAA
jgi:hypothetical protein